LLAALPLMILTVAPQFFNQMNPRFEYATDEQVLQFMRRYVLAHALVLFVALVILRQWAARLYASAVLKVVRRGRVRPGELHPAVAGWLRRTGADLGGQAGRGGVLGAAKAGGGWLGRRAGYVLLFLIWAAFLFLVMVSEFFNYHPWYGFLNQPL